jgi:outer membrane cobalamin receptor
MSHLSAIVLSLVLGSALVLTGESAAHAQTAGPAVAGVVLDQQGAVVVRAHVTLVDASGRRLAATVTDDRGRFSMPAAPCVGCRVTVSLTGFSPASAPADATGEIAVTLDVAPIREAVVVSATRDPAPTSQVGSAVTVFDAVELERRGRPRAGELLRSVPGFAVVQTGGPGGQTSAFARAGESSYNKVLLDGMPLNEPGGTFNFANLTTEHLERIEIVRGPQSALFGSDAMSSVVQLFTRRAAGGRRADASGALDVGSHGTVRASGSLGGRPGRWDYRVGAARYHTDNHVPNNAFDNTTLSWSAGRAAGDALSVRATGRLERQRAGVPGQTAFGRPDLDASFTRRDAAAGVTIDQRLGRVRQRIVYAYTRSGQVSANLTADPPYVPSFGDRRAPFAFSDFSYHNANLLERHHASYQADWPLGRANGDHFATAALDWDGERARLETRLSGTVVRASRNNVGLTLQHQGVGRVLAVTTGIRFERNASFGTAVAPRIAAALRASDGRGWLGSTILNGTAGLGVKEPTILQSFSPSPSFLGNPDLEPERSRAVELGVEQRLVHDRLKIDAVWFAARYRNQISTIVQGFEPYRAQYFNVGVTRARGLELTVDAAPGSGLRARGGYTFTSSEILTSTAPDNPLFAPGAWAFRRPRHAGLLEIDWTGGPLALDLAGLFTGRRVDSDFALLEPSIDVSPARAVWSAAARYRLHRRVELTLRVENLTDVEYMEPLGYPAWGRAFMGGIRVATH